MKPDVSKSAHGFSASASAFRRTCLGLEVLPSVVPLFLAIVCLDQLVEWTSRAQVMAVVWGLVSGLGTIAAGWRYRQSERERIADAFDASRSLRGDRAETELAAALMRWPESLGRERMVATFLCIASLPLLFATLGIPAAFETSWLRSLLLVSMASSALAAGLQYYASRIALRPFAEWLSDSSAAIEVAVGPVEPAMSGLSLSRTLALALFVPAAFSVLILLDQTAHASRRAAQADALRWCQASIEMLLDVAEESPRLEVPILEEPPSEPALAGRIARQQKRQASWPYPVRLLAISPGGAEVVTSRPLSPAFLDQLGLALETAAVAGHVTGPEAQEVGRFRRLATGEVIVATVNKADLRSVPSGSSERRMALLGGLLLGLLAWSMLVLRDVGDSLSRLRNLAEGLVDGDFRSRTTFESQQEMAGLGTSLEIARRQMRAGVTGTRTSLERVAQLTETTMTIGRRLSEEASEQTQRLAGVSELVGRVSEKVASLRVSAESMNESVDESSSSVAELGAASGQLNQTASVLSSQIDEVSGSMEHMVQSVKQVGEITDRLAGASEDTSSSMEEMASAMRMIDTSAESMAVLSRDVVDKAELGQESVRQTIVGMEAIRDATDAAERVIRGLGARTSEIGGILDVIEDVADETNLLALNAAIIAAQAGEQGKAFSVVADQIKELADRVLASTKEIGGLIRSVQDESENAIGAIAAGSESVLSGVALSAEAGRTLEEITDASRETGNRIAEIVASVREQTTAAAHVVSLMERVRDSADEIHAASEEQRQGNEVIYRSSLTMREVAQQVHRTTDEQSGGFVRIRESIEGGRSEIETIQQALEEQAGACGEVAAFLEEAFEGTRFHGQAAASLENTTLELMETLRALRDDVERFRVE